MDSGKGPISLLQWIATLNIDKDTQKFGELKREMRQNEREKTMKNAQKITKEKTRP